MEGCCGYDRSSCCSKDGSLCTLAFLANSPSPRGVGAVPKRLSLVAFPDLEIDERFAQSGEGSEGAPPCPRSVCLECLPGHAASGRPKNRLDRKVHRAILDCLRDPHSNVRFWACYAAGQMEISAARSALRGLIDDDGLSCMGWTVGYEATEALKALQGEPAWDDGRLPGECPYPPLW